MNWKEIYAKLPEMTEEENSELIRAVCARNITLGLPDGQRVLSSGQDVGLALMEKFFDTERTLDGTPLMSEETVGAIQDVIANGEDGPVSTAKALLQLPGDAFLRQIHEAAQQSFDDAMESYCERLKNKSNGSQT